jgi:acylphosphatase
MVARGAGVAGWVRNRHDGSVEAEIEGTPEQVDEVLAWMAQGPPGSQVDTATVTDAAPTGEHGFEVRS